MPIPGRGGLCLGLAKLFWGEGLKRERVDALDHRLVQGAVHQAMASDLRLAGKGRGHHHSFIVVASACEIPYPNDGIGYGLGDEGLDLFSGDGLKTFRNFRQPRLYSWTL